MREEALSHNGILPAEQNWNVGLRGIGYQKTEELGGYNLEVAFCYVVRPGVLPFRPFTGRLPSHSRSRSPDRRGCYMQLLHGFRAVPVFSRAHRSSSRLLDEQIFMVLVRLALLSPCLKWPQYA
jgi:hypothetical protein